jgi:heptosyltransferase-2
MPTQQKSLFGVFKGMGDLLWASPVIRAELDRGFAVHLLVFPNPSLISFCSLIDFGNNSDRLYLHSIPEGFKGLFAFMREMRTLSPKYIWISPHAPAADASWRVPLLLHLLRRLFWREARLIGTDSEPFASLFDERLEVDRTLPLSYREWMAYRQFRRGDSLPAEPPRPSFIAAVSDARNQAPIYDLIIHPGANARNRIWPHDKYPALLAALPAHWKIAFLGLPSDIAAVQAVLPPGAPERYDFLTGSVSEVLQVLATARLLLVMNSGMMHFAEVLGVPAVAIFGQQAPADVIGEGWIIPVFQISVPCQPCGRATCGQPAVYCLTQLNAGYVAGRLVQLASASL